MFRSKFVRSGNGNDQQFLIRPRTDVMEKRMTQRPRAKQVNTDNS